MKNFFLNVILVFASFLLSNCSSIQDSLSGKKRNNVDEFLVEKKSPLVLPPEFEKLPVPGKEAQNEKDDNNSIKKLLSPDTLEIAKDSNNQGTSTLEGSILEKIKE